MFDALDITDANGFLRAEVVEDFVWNAKDRLGLATLDLDNFTRLPLSEDSCFK